MNIIPNSPVFVDLPELDGEEKHHDTVSPTSASRIHFDAETKVDSPEERRKRLEKALKTLGTSCAQLERHKALQVLGLTEENLQQSAVYFTNHNNNHTQGEALEPITLYRRKSLPSIVFSTHNHRLVVSFSQPCISSADNKNGSSDVKSNHTDEAVADAHADAHAHTDALTKSNSEELHSPRRTQKKAVAWLGLDDYQASRIKATRVLGVSDFEVDEARARALAAIGDSDAHNFSIAHRRKRSMSVHNLIPCSLIATSQ